MSQKESGGQSSDVALPHRSNDEAEIKRLVLSRVEEEQREHGAPSEARPPGEEIIDSEIILQALSANEDGDASLFIRLNRGRFCYDAADGTWFVFKGPHWIEDRLGEAARSIDKIINLYAMEAKRQAEIRIDAVKAGNTSEAGRAAQNEKDLIKRLKYLHTVGRKDHTLVLSRTGADSLAIAGDGWDEDPWIIGCLNGIIDLKTGDLREGKPGDYIRTIATVNYPGKGTAIPPVFESFLDDICTGDKELSDYLHRLFGYGITGHANIHTYPIFYGPQGRNGKSTLLEILKYILGDLAQKARSEILLETKYNAPRGGADADTLSLRGKRLVWATETGEGRKLNASRIKELAGGDTLSARAPFGKYPVEFRPSHLLILLTNFKPNPPANDDAALWERIRLIEFKSRFVEEPAAPEERKADPDLLDKLKEEASGIFAWLIQGCLKWQEVGLTAPESVKINTGSYRKDADILGKYIDSRLNFGLHMKVQAGPLLKDYRSWCDELCIKPMNGIRFYQAMDERFDSEPGRYVHYLGVGLKSELEGVPF